MPNPTAFGQTPDGHPVHRFAIGAGDLTVHILTIGAALQSVRLAGVDRNLTLGSDILADYLGEMRYHGTLIAPVVNRLRDGRAALPGDGGQIQTPRNQDGQHTLHSGPGGTQLKIWQLVAHGGDFVVLALDLPDGEAGFPGNRQVRARYQVMPDARLRLEVTARTDAPTIWNAANHSYWNLDGGADYAGHSLQVTADRYLPADQHSLPTGAVQPVAGTSFDFRQPRPIAPGAPLLDNCLCLADAPRALTPVLCLTGRSGIRMQVATTEPGVQLYDGRDARRPGHGTGEGLAIECQIWPDAPNHARFPSIALMPGQDRVQVTEWQFFRNRRDVE